MAEFLIRLRATSNGIEDLAGNTWTNNNVTNTGTGKFGGKALTFASDGSQLYMPMTSDLLIKSNEDFTVSFWAKTTERRDSYAFINDYGIIFSPCYMLSNNVYVKWRIALGIGKDNYIFDQASAESYVLNTWVHMAMTRQGGTIRCFYDGNIVYTHNNYTGVAGNASYPIGIGGWGSSMPSSRTYRGYMDDVCYIKGKALWTEDFTPPTSYLEIPTYAYLSNNNLYTDASLTNLTNNWSGMTSVEKEALVPFFSDEIPSIQDLATISPFRVLTSDISLTNVKVTGQPKSQIIEPTSLINTGAVSTIQSINITNTLIDAVVKFAITTDLSTYKVYDATTSSWVTSTNIEEDGMSIAQINALTPQILSQLDISNGIAFKQCFIATSENASAELSEISAVVNIDGSWTQSVHGTDYNVSYPNKTTMSVRLLINGDYIINYPISSNS